MGREAKGDSGTFSANYYRLMLPVATFSFIYIPAIGLVKLYIDAIVGSLLNLPRLIGGMKGITIKSYSLSRLNIYFSAIAARVAV